MQVLDYFMNASTGIRGAQFSMVQKANYTIFGGDFPAAQSYYGKLMDNVIEHKNIGFNQWTIALSAYKTNANF